MGPSACATRHARFACPYTATLAYDGAFKKMLLLVRWLASVYVLTTLAMRAYIHIAFVRIQCVICIMGCSTGCYIGYNFLLVMATIGIALDDDYKAIVCVAFGGAFAIIYTRYQKAGIIFYTSGAWAPHMPQPKLHAVA